MSSVTMQSMPIAGRDNVTLLLFTIERDTPKPESPKYYMFSFEVRKHEIERAMDALKFF